MIIIRRHWAAVLLSLLIGMIYASHHFFIPNFFQNNDGVYQPITSKEYYDESLFYAPKAASIFWGRGVGGDFSTAEYIGGASIVAPLNSLVLGYLMKIFGSVECGFIVSDFIFPAGIFFLIYLLIFEITNEISASMLAASIFALTPKLALYLPPMSLSTLKELIYGIIPFYNPETLYFSEFDDPKITFFFMSLFVYFTFRSLNRGGRMKTIMAGIAFGALFYSYPYYWATAATTLSLVAMILYWKKRPYIIKRIFVIAIIGFSISLFYWLNILELTRTTPDVLARLGGEVSRNFRFATVWKHYARIIALVVLSWFALRKINKKAWMFVSAYLLSFIVAVNIQVLTGFNAQPDHWYRTQFLPTFLAIFLIAYYFYERYLDKYISKKILVNLFLVWIIGSNIVGQYFYSEAYAMNFYIPKSRYESYVWLRNNTSPNDVVGTLSLEANPAIQTFSHNKIFLPFGLSTLASNEELWERLEILAKLFGITTTQFRHFIVNENGLYYLTVEQYGDKSFDAAFGDYDRVIHPDELGDRVLDYSFYLKSDINSSKYKLDYLYFDKENARWGRNPKYLEKVFENSAAIIYKL